MQEQFFEWLDHILQDQPLPGETVAANFNLYEESEDNAYAVQLIGAGEFDPEDEDWACEEVYSSEEDLFVFTDENNTGDENNWERALETCVSWVSAYLAGGTYAQTLKALTAVAVGFVDGNLEIVYTNEA